MLLACAAAIILIILLLVLIKKPALYPGFGVRLPLQQGLIGIDVSRHQGRIYWQEAARMRDQGKQLHFAIIKATEGADLADVNYSCNRIGAQEAGLTVGAYHFFHPVQNARMQAENFLRTAQIREGMLRPVLDVEVADGLRAKAIRDSICIWIAFVEDELRTAPILYTNTAFYNQYLKGWVDDYPLWIAHYDALKPGVETDFQLWQFSDRGRVNGVGAAVDFNLCPGDSAAFRKLVIAY